MADARQFLNEWRIYDNRDRLHTVSGYLLPPAVFSCFRINPDNTCMDLA